MERLSAISSLRVSQQKEWGEIITGFETKNKYAVSDEAGRNLYIVAEKHGPRLVRWLLKALRPFTIDILAENGQVVLQVIRPFRVYFHQARILDSQNRSLGVIERRFSILRRTYSVINSSGEEACTISGPIMQPWTFHIRSDGIDCGKITKKWSGLLKETFTDADDFNVTFPVEWNVRLKALVLGAVFLIDFVHFENKGRH